MLAKNSMPKKWDLRWLIPFAAREVRVLEVSCGLHGVLLGYESDDKFESKLLSEVDSDKDRV